MMKNLSVKTWVIMGFFISVGGIILNVFVVSNLNNKVRETETELTKIKESLRTQANEISLADLQNNLFAVLNHISQTQTGDQKTSSSQDAIYIMRSYLKRVYAAANDIPAIDVLKAENEQLTADLKNYEKAAEALKKKEEGNEAEFERLLKEAEEVEKANNAAKSELNKKLDDAIATADAEKLVGKNNDEIVFATIPTYKVINEQFIASFQKKEARIKELEEQKNKDSWWANLLTYLAVSMQMFGLLCVLNKDLPKGNK